MPSIPDDRQLPGGGGSPSGSPNVDHLEELGPPPPPHTDLPLIL